MFQRYQMGDSRVLMSRFHTGSAKSDWLPFSLMSLGEFHCGQGYYTEREGMEQCLLIVTLSGCGSMTVQGVRREISAGKGVVIDCRDYQYYASEGDWHFYWVHFRGSAAQSFTRYVNEGGLRLLEGEAEEDREFFARMAALCGSSGPAADRRLSLLLYEWLLRLSGGGEAAGEEDARQMRAVADHIRRHVDSPLRVEDLAARCHLSCYHFIRLFHRVVGQPPYAYLTSCRIQEAKRLLTETREPVASIARQVGFSDAKGFIACFKKRTGTTPLQFRRMLLPGPPVTASGPADGPTDA